MKLRTVLLSAGSLALAATTWAALQEGGMPGPGKQHEILKRMDGSWEAEYTMAMMPDQVVHATEVNRLIGGMWLVSDFEADYMGMPFEGHGVTGWDPVKEQYVQTWVDSMSAHMSMSYGTLDEAADVIEYRGVGYDMMGNPTESRSVVTLGEDAMEVEMFMGGEPFMTIRYTRAPDGDR